ncbi:MAG: T9SS type A sorting domain-containing protein [Candidatus Cloacimonetes bacterium]|nr:T9SS type A sorting domain-containing protein [Candidatus Cloacimonadota bacterium]
MIKVIRVILIGCLFILMFVGANATIINVPADQPTIQLGLNFASSGDTVLVSPGTYYENIIWPEVNGIVLLSESGAEHTIIDGSNITNTIKVYECYPNIIDTTTIIDGFTICNGNASNTFGGGGIYAHDADPVVQYCIIKNNTAPTVGGGGGILHHIGSKAIIRYNIIRNNSTSDDGGGIYLCCSSADVYGNEIYNNNSARGGCISCYKTWEHFIKDNEIYNNICIYAGGGIYSKESSSFIEKNNIHHNIVSMYGGGIFIASSANLEIIHNQIHHNEANESGGGVCLLSSPSLSFLHQNDIFQNHAINHGAGVYCVSAYDTLNAENNWWGDASGPYNELLNPNGTGNEVYGTVDFIPWALEPFFPYTEISDNNYPEVQNINKLFQNYPNPFSSSTAISFNLATKSHEKAKIKIYNVKGQSVKKLLIVNGQSSIKWDGKDEKCSHLSSGIYFYQLQIDNKVIDTKKCLILR